MMSEPSVFSRITQPATGLPLVVRRLTLLAALGVAVLVGTACGGSDDQPALDESLSRDLNLAGAASSTAPIAFGDTAAEETSETPTPELGPVATAPRRAPVPAPDPKPKPTPTPQPAPRPERAPLPDPTPVEGEVAPAAFPAPVPAPVPAPAPAPSRRELLGIGSALVGTTSGEVCTTSNRPGDRVVMRLTSAVSGPDGARLEAGTPVLLELAATDSGLVFRVKGVSVDGELYPVRATASIESEMKGSRVAGGSDTKKVIGGAIAGAILGQILGKDTRSTVIGAAGGAAAGTIAARRSGTTEQCLPAGGTVRVVLVEPLIVTGSGP